MKQTSEALSNEQDQALRRRRLLESGRVRIEREPEKEPARKQPEPDQDRKDEKTSSD